jgi:hypothetical protein
MEWVSASEEDSSRIFWLHGMAGEGKSVITASVAKWMEDSQQCLGASFCFSRKFPDRNCPDLLITTIAYQISKRFPLVGLYIDEVLRQDPDITTRTVHDQFTALLLKPLASTAWAFRSLDPFVLVLDGLDECGSESTRSSIRSIFRRLHELPAFVKVFVSSRTERDLQGLFDSMHPQVERYDLGETPRAIVDGDIKEFIDARMSAIVNVRENMCGIQWPDDSICSALVRQSSSVFLWASRAMNFIEFGDTLRINTLLNGVPGSSEDDDQFRGLEDVYIDVLEAAYPRTASTASLKQFRGIVGMIITLRQEASPDALGILHISKSRGVIEVISKLRPIMTISGSNHESPEMVRIIHPSFKGFLSSTRCPSRFFIDSMATHANCVRKCLVRIHQLPRGNICGIQDEELLNAEIEDLPTILRMNLTDDIRYACRFWTYHLSHSPGNNDELYGLVKSFILEDLRKWMEILSLLGVLDRVNESLELCKGWILVSQFDLDIFISTDL